MDDVLKLIYEGMYDPCIFKAIFIVGGPGSGKTWIKKKLALGHMGFVSIDSDYPLEKYMRQANLSLKMPPEEHDERTIIRQKAKRVTDSKEESVLDNRLGLAFAGTGSNLSDTFEKNDMLKKLGYDTAMIFVNTDLRTALSRNENRNRSVPKQIVIDKWTQSQRNLGEYQRIFNPFWVLDNNGDIRTERQILNVFNKIKNWCKKTPTNKKVGDSFEKWRSEKNI
jgi:shikimate kinase